MNKRRKLLLFTFPAVCCSLGIWQVQRLKWKTQLLNDLEHSYKLKPYQISEYTGGNTVPVPFHRYRLVGSFVQKPQIALIGPRFIHKKPGYKLIVPFALKNNNEIHLVDIGWIEEGKSIEKVISTLPNPAILSELDVIHIKEERLGIIEKLIQWTSHGMDKRTSFSKYLTSDIVQRMEITQSSNFYMFQALPTNRPTAPFRSILDIDSIPNNHLEYAITW
jgi:surfeit locus 1 family protein